MAVEIVDDRELVEKPLLKNKRCCNFILIVKYENYLWILKLTKFVVLYQERFVLGKFISLL